MLAGAHAVNHLLHFAVPAIAAFDGVGSGWQQGLVEEGQGLFHGGGKQLLERLAKVFEATDASAKPRQFGLRGVAAATPVEEPVDLIDDLPQGPQTRLAPGDALQGLVLTRSKTMADKQMAMLKEVGNSGGDTPLFDRQFALGPGGPAPSEFRERGLELPTNRGQALEDTLVEFPRTWNWQT
jgi:hypothetical protein